MRLQVIEAFPLLDDDERVAAVWGLERADALGIDRGAILDAAGLGMDRGHVGMEGFQDLAALAGFGGDDGDDVDHEGTAPWLGRVVAPPAMMRQSGARAKTWVEAKPGTHFSGLCANHPGISACAGLRIASP